MAEGATRQHIDISRRNTQVERKTSDRGARHLRPRHFCSCGRVCGRESTLAHYWVTAYGDFAIGNYMTEAILPTILNQDPRYFRRGSGSGWARLESEVRQIFRIHTDSGGRRFNHSEIARNAPAVAISMAYYPGNRTAPNAVDQIGMQIAAEMSANIAEEFWPSRDRKAASAPR